MLVEDNGCVKHCRAGNHNNGKGECVKCIGDACNKGIFTLRCKDNYYNPRDGRLVSNIDLLNVKVSEKRDTTRGGDIELPVFLNRYVRYWISM